MAAIILVIGGCLGFAVAVLSLFLGMGVLWSLALWIGTGLGCGLLAAVFALVPRRSGAPARV